MPDQNVSKSTLKTTIKIKSQNDGCTYTSSIGTSKNPTTVYGPKQMPVQCPNCNSSFVMRTKADSKQKGWKYGFYLIYKG